MNYRAVVRRFVSLLAPLVLFVTFVQAPQVLAQEDATGQVQQSPATTKPTPPLAPVGRDGRQLQGAWEGPYSFRNVHSGKCLDVNGTYSGAPVVQHECLAGWASQAWYMWFVQGDGNVAYWVLSNGYTGNCLDVFNFAKGAAVISVDWCTTLDNQQWGRTAANRNLYFNGYTQFCMEVGGWATGNAAPVIQWDCFGNRNQLWLQYDWK